MLTFPHLRVNQIAYVTTDLDEALKRVEDAFGLSQYYFINTPEQPSHPQQPGLRIALVRTAGTEFELIEPLGYNDSVWSDSLPKNGTLALQFHHVAATVHGTMAEFARSRATWDLAHKPIVVEGWEAADRTLDHPTLF